MSPTDGVQEGRDGPGRKLLPNTSYNETWVRHERLRSVYSKKLLFD